MLFFNLDLLTPNCKTEMEIGRERNNEKKNRKKEEGISKTTDFKKRKTKFISVSK
jgi:hypothetical protein